MRQKRRSSSRKKSKFLLVLVVLALISVVAYVKISANQRDLEDNETASPPVLLEKKNATFGTPINSQQEFNVFITNEEATRKSLSMIQTVSTDSIDWDTRGLVPVEFYTSAGQILEGIVLGDDGAVNVTMLGIPKGCLQPAVQYKYIGFVEVTRGNDLTGSGDVNFHFRENKAECLDGGVEIEEIR